MGLRVERRRKGEISIKKEETLVDLFVVSLLLFHLFEDWSDHIECGPLSRIFVHADSNEFGDVRTRTGRNRNT